MITKRLDHPGLIFPDSPLHAQNKPENQPVVKNRKPAVKRTIANDIPTDWGITTEQICRRLGISASAARQYMHRHDVPYKRISNPLVGPALLFWEKSKVMALISSYPKNHEKLPTGYITGKEARMLFNVSNTTLTRIARRYKIPTKLIKYSKNNSGRMHRVYERDAILEVLRLYQSSGFYACVN